MIDHHDPTGHLDQSRLHRDRCFMRVHKDKQRMRRHHGHRLIWRYKSLNQCLILLNSLHQPLNARVRTIQYNMSFYLVHISSLQHTDGCTYNIKVRHAVPHDDHPVALLHQIAQRMRDNPGADSRPLLYGACLTAVE
ncbi:hypothetical protein D3C81_1121030 [compost metagenome]